MSKDELQDLISDLGDTEITAQQTISFEDASIMVILATKGQAHAAFYSHCRKMIDAIHQDILERAGVCCPELKANLGGQVRYPRLVYISQANWDSGPRRAGWYQGATGPGYYEVWDIAGKAHMTPVGDVSDTVYLPLAHCPFCHTALNAGGVGE